MRASSEFWAAVRLTEFANLHITSTTWESLFRQKEEIYYEKSLRALARPRLPGDLWAAFVEGVRRYKPPTPSEVNLAMAKARDRARRRKAGQVGWVTLDVKVEVSESPLAPWPSIMPSVEASDASPKIKHEDLVRLQATTRRRLRLLCEDDADLDRLVTELQKSPPPPRRFGPLWGGRVTKWFPFGFVSPLVSMPLSTHLDQLFVRAAEGGYWSRIYQCACGRFNVARLRRDSRQRPPSKFCVESPACRAGASRTRSREAKEVLRRRVVSYVKKHQEVVGVDRARAMAMEEFNLTRRELDALLGR